MDRERGKSFANESTRRHQVDKSSNNQIAIQLKNRSRSITFCLISFIGAISSLSPFVSLHLHQKVGLLLFESELIQLRSSLLSALVCLIFLVIFNIIIFVLIGKNSRSKRDRSLIIRKLLSFFVGLFAISSAISYLSIVFLVPQIKQIQRMPLANFDCNANLITIENCQQQFTNYQRNEESLLDTIKEILLDDINENGNRLIERLNCLKYNYQEYQGIPTRFLLHNCGLVCRPHRQQLHQFSDDLNQDQGNWPRVVPQESEVAKPERSSTGNVLIPPYITQQDPTIAVKTKNKAESLMNEQRLNNIDTQLTMKVCFSGEFSGNSNNYKQFCITNLANTASNQQELTVGKLNLMLKRLVPLDQNYESETYTSRYESSISHEKKTTVKDHSTSYINPVVQFESHFKNWPNIPGKKSSVAGFEVDDDSWCKFKPIPPFIVNNKPFNDIQCSLEHEYVMTTNPPLGLASSRSQDEADRIYLKKSSSTDGSSSESLNRERCSIQCKVNILYQIHGNKVTEQEDSSIKDETTSYYLPLKPCVILSGDGDKARTSNYYFYFRSIGESSLLLTLILLDLILLLESLDTKQFPLEAKKIRFVGLLLVMIAIPLLGPLLFDLAESTTNQQASTKSRQDGQLLNFINERLLPSLNDLISLVISFTYNKQIDSTDFSDSNRHNFTVETRNYEKFSLDSFTIPFFIYALLMFILAISSFRLPLVVSDVPLVRISSIEELGIQTKDKVKKMDKQSGNILDKREAKKINPNSKLDKIQTTKVMFISIVTLFMGLQFHLSEQFQTIIYMESFDNPAFRSGKTETTFWFVVITHSSSISLILVLSLLFLDEVSTFLASFSPFKTNDQLNNVKSNQAKWLQYLISSLFIYSIRFYTLSKLNHLSQFKLPIVILFQAAELVNFSLVWFVLSARAHEIFMEHPLYAKYRNLSNENQAHDIHMAIQSLMSLTYFILARFLALFVRSLHASLHLHSDNIDWFITNFYQSLETTQTNQPIGSSKDNPTAANSTSAFGSSLFSPLPDERQTHLHASRLFLKYNSLICLLMAILLLVALVYTKYQIWSERCKTVDFLETKTVSFPRLEDSLDERLAKDLQKIHRFSSPLPETRTVQPERDFGKRRAQAKVLYHYDLGRGDSSDEEQRQRSVPMVPMSKLKPIREVSPTKDESAPPLEAEVEEDVPEPPKEYQDVYVERIVKHRSKKVKIFEDDEIWSNGTGSGQLEESLSESRPMVRPMNRKTRITFGPTTTMEAGHRRPPVSIVPIRRASPDPSICNDDKEEMHGNYVESDSIEGRR